LGSTGHIPDADRLIIKTSLLHSTKAYNTIVTRRKQTIWEVGRRGNKKNKNVGVQFLTSSLYPTGGGMKHGNIQNIRNININQSA
jgi:hypothetical protein